MITPLPKGGTLSDPRIEGQVSNPEFQKRSTVGNKELFRFLLSAFNLTSKIKLNRQPALGAGLLEQLLHRGLNTCELELVWFAPQTSLKTQ